jgi:hypothetical protein
MRNKHRKIIAAVFSIALVCWLPAEGKMLKGKLLYRVGLTKDSGKSVAVRQNGNALELNLENFASPVALKVNGGGVESCRTILEHKSDKATIILSLPIPTPNMPCQMTAGFVSINSQTYKISMSEAEVKKTSGNDGQLRKLVEKYFGKI